MESHEDAGTTFRVRAFSTKPLDFAVRIDFVVFQDGHLDLLSLVLNLLRSIVLLLLTLLRTSSQTQDKMQRRLFLDIIVAQSSTILQLFPSKDETLLIRRYPFLILNFGFHIIDGVGRLYFKSNRLPGQGLDEDLHDGCLTKQ